MPDDFDEIPKLTDLFRMVASEFFDVKEEFVNIVIDEPLENTNHPVYINLLVSEMQKNMILKGFERVDIVFSEEINEIIDSLMSGEMSELFDMTGVKPHLTLGSISDPIATSYTGYKIYWLFTII